MAENRQPHVQVPQVCQPASAWSQGDRDTAKYSPGQDGLEEDGWENDPFMAK